MAEAPRLGCNSGEALQACSCPTDLQISPDLIDRGRSRPGKPGLRGGHQGVHATGDPEGDAIILVITEDYNRALLAWSGPGEGVRFEVKAALQEKTIRQSLQIIPLLLEGTRPVPPFDRMKCAVPEAIEDVITQLGLPRSPANRSC
jgi:hypothetical protein